MVYISSCCSPMSANGFHSIAVCKKQDLWGEGLSILWKLRIRRRYIDLPCCEALAPGALQFEIISY